jgi:hypothetical protein
VRTVEGVPHPECPTYSARGCLRGVHSPALWWTRGCLVVASLFATRSMHFTGCLGKPFSPEGLKRALAATRDSPWFFVTNE